MKKNYSKLSQEKEIEILSQQLDPIEMQTLMYLKGFNRKILKEWNEKGLMDFSIEY